MKVKQYRPIISNKKFQSLSKIEKKKIIAKDVLSRIKAENLDMTSGSIFKYTTRNRGSVKKFVNTSLCKVCIRGSIFCSLVGIQNKLKFENINLSTPHSENNWEHDVKNIFTKRELGILELLFETNGSIIAYNLSIGNSAKNWYKIKHELKNYFNYDSEKITIFIMNHVARHGKITINEFKKEMQKSFKEAN